MLSHVSVVCSNLYSSIRCAGDEGECGKHQLCDLILYLFYLK